jgi:pyridoxal phosphate enzyme (YggS family)
MSIADRLNRIKEELPATVRLVAVSKLHGIPAIREAYDAGQRLFGESRVQELLAKYEQLPPDIEWHFIGHLQENKVKQIAPFIDTVQSVDSLKLLEKLNEQAGKNHRRINVLLQVHIAREEHKFGFSFDEIENLLESKIHETFIHLNIRGLMGIATFTDDEKQIREEFSALAHLFGKLKERYFAGKEDFNELSIGMSDDYLLAIEEGSTMVRIGTKLFGERKYDYGNHI